MAAFPSFDQRRSERDRGIAFGAMLALAVASALTGAVVAVVVQRYLQRRQYIDILPSPAPTAHLQEAAAASTARRATVTPDLAQQPASMRASSGSGAGEGAPRSPGADQLNGSRAAELGRTAAEDDDVMAAEGSGECPTEFPIKGNGRSSIYHWPGSRSYASTRATLCFRTTEAADRAGFRPAMR